MLDLTNQLCVAGFVVCFGIAIHGFWIPAIPAGMTDRRVTQILMYNDERSAWKQGNEQSSRESEENLSVVRV